jgi:Holliday junction resolvase RusA-like endonuclease
MQRTLRSLSGQPPIVGFVGLGIEIICRVSASWTKQKTRLALAGKLFPTHCDIDNQVKSLSGAMNRIVFEDGLFTNSLIVRREYGLDDKAIVTARVMLEQS